MAASREQSGSPGLSIIPAVRYAMLSITKALRAIIANFSYSSRAKTHTLVTSDHMEKGWLFILLLGKNQVYLNHTKLRQTSVKLLSGCSVLCGQFWKKKQMEMIMSDWRRFIILHILLISQLFIFLPISFLIIPAEELPILNLPELRMFMATYPTRSKCLVHSLT